MLAKSKTVYRVEYFFYEPSYYDRSDKIYTTKDFNTRQEAFTFVDELKKRYPAQVTITRLTTQCLLDCRDTDEYQENRAMSKTNA